MRYDHGHPVDETRRCEAKTKVGRQCRNYALVGEPRCALHGGEAAEHNRRGMLALSRTDARIAELLAESNKRKKRGG